MAVLFGAITLKIKNQNDIEIYGIWRGKKLNDWEKENLKIITSNEIIRHIKKDLDILQHIKTEEDFIDE